MRGPRLPTARFFQLGYVTRDLDAALGLYRERHGLTLFHRFEQADVRVALAWHGATMIELIAPAPGHDGLFAEALAGPGLVNLHHLAYWVDPAGFDALPAICEALALASPVHWRTEHLSVFFADTRADTGLYSEFILVPDPGKGLFAAVPQNDEM